MSEDENRKVGVSLRLRRKWLAIIDKWVAEEKFKRVHYRGQLVEYLVEKEYELQKNRDFEVKLHGENKQ